jgi:glycosyltransferase involved in cell wall biosynthesis
MKQANSLKLKHILFLTYHLPLENEPGAFRPWMEARLLVKAGYKVTVVTSGVQYMTGEDIRPYKAWCTEEFVEGVRILRTWAPKDHRRSLLRRVSNYLAYTILAGLVSVLSVRRVDRIFAGTDPIFMMPMVYLVSLIKRAPMVMDERDLYPETAIALGVMKQGVLSNIIFYIQQFFRRQAVGILAATPGIKKRLLSYGVPEGKVHLLYNADVFMDEDIGTEQSVESLRKLSNRNFLVGYVGGLGRANDIPTLLRAAERLNGFEQVGFVIVGSGEMRESYMDFCKQRGLDNVVFLPAVPRKQARALLKQMDICVHLYPKGELFNGALASKTFDYHGLGKPMIFCGQGDTVNLLQETEGGLAVPSEDDEALAEAIRKLVKDDVSRERMGTSARQWYKKNIGTGAACALMKKVMENHASV